MAHIQSETMTSLHPRNWFLFTNFLILIILKRGNENDQQSLKRWDSVLNLNKTRTYQFVHLRPVLYTMEHKKIHLIISFPAFCWLCPNFFETSHSNLIQNELKCLIGLHPIAYGSFVWSFSNLNDGVNHFDCVVIISIQIKCH